VNHDHPEEMILSMPLVPLLKEPILKNFQKYQLMLQVGKKDLGPLSKNSKIHLNPLEKGKKNDLSHLLNQMNYTTKSLKIQFTTVKEAQKKKVFQYSFLKNELWRTTRSRHQKEPSMMMILATKPPLFESYLPMIVLYPPVLKYPKIPNPTKSDLVLSETVRTLFHKTSIPPSFPLELEKPNPQQVLLQMKKLNLQNSQNT
jgi:hypothetical protein